MLSIENFGVRITARRVLTAILLPLSLAIAAPAFSSGNGAGIPPEAIGVDSRGNRLQGLDFGTGTVDTRNTDSNWRRNFESVGLAPSRCDDERVDGFVTDFLSGDVHRYRNAAGVRDTICRSRNGGCPSNPGGISIAPDGLLAIGDSPIFRDNARVWLQGPESSCNSNGVGSFGAAVKLDSSLTLPEEDCVQVGDACLTDIALVVDTEFLKAPVGDFESGDLFVLTGFPTAIFRYSKGHIDCRLEGECGSNPNPEPLVVLDNPGDWLPSGLAILPGGEILVASTRGVIEAYKIVGSGLVQTNLPFASGLDFGLGGIDAKLLGGEEVVMAAHWKKGRYYKWLVNRDTSTNDPTGTHRTSLSPSYVNGKKPRPRDVAINQVQLEGSECVSNEFQFGCPLVSMNILYNGQTPPPGSTVQETQTFAVCDDRNPFNPGPLPLSNLGFTGTLGSLVVPETLIGIEIPGNNSCRALLISEVTKSFPIIAGAWVEVQGNAENVIPGIGTCPATDGRVFYHPIPGTVPLWPEGSNNPGSSEGSEFGDITQFCDNPRRGLGRDNSFLVQGTSALLFRQNLSNTAYLQDVKAEAISRANNIIATLDQVNGIGTNLKAKLVNAANNVLGFLNSAPGTRTYDLAFKKAGKVCFDTAQLVASKRDRFDEAPEVGDVLSRFGNCSLFLAEEGRGIGDYEPPFMGLEGQTPPDLPPIIPGITVP